jgi:hypothetical protein
MSVECDNVEGIFIQFNHLEDFRHEDAFYSEAAF